MSNKHTDIMKTLRNTTMIIAILLTGLFSNQLFANTVIGELEKENPIQKKREKLKQLRKFKRSINKKSNLAGFSYHQKMYVVNADISTVWEAYTQAKPTEVWKGPLNTFKNSYSQADDTLYDTNDSLIPSIELGMVFELNLRVAKLMDVAVAFQITELDSTNKLIEFTYGKDNKSHGRQRIVFIADGAQTIIAHYSNFKSSSKFRDKHLYPLFHERCMDEFHANMNKSILNEQVTELLSSLK
ncbi:MAG: hypothetical protein ACI9J3_000052 [Parvicellaceae bacterium]|jgi:hypothetical protein